MNRCLYIKTIQSINEYENELLSKQIDDEAKDTTITEQHWNKRAFKNYEIHPKTEKKKT